VTEDEKLAFRLELEEFIVKCEWEGGTLYVLENWPSMVPNDEILQQAATELRKWNEIFDDRIAALEAELIYAGGIRG
jgi:hypothetical protein